MSIEPIGIATFLFGLICLMMGSRASVIGLLLMSLFGSAAAIIVGAANVQPGHLFLGFTLVTVVFRRREVAAFIRELHPRRPGFWFACLLVYGVVSGFFHPRLFAGVTEIIPLGSSEFASTGFTVPLGPVSSNFTQSVYMAANVLCFLAFGAIASSRDGFQACVDSLITYAIGFIFFAFLDLGTYFTGTQDLLEFMRNAQYTLHTDAEIAGLKRIVGSFTEASAFARSGLGVFAIMGTLWLCAYRPLLTGTLAAVSLILLLLSTSSTGLAVAPVVMVLLYLTALGRCGVRRDARVSSAVVLAAPIIVSLAALMVLLVPSVRIILVDYFDLLVLSKSGSDSGIERGSWNIVALQNVIDSYGMGVGLGTIRTSSFAVSLIASVGVPGTIFFVVFVVLALFTPRGTPRTFYSDVRIAARNGCFGLMLGDLLVSPAIDLGLIFSVLAAIAAAEPERDPAPARIAARAEAAA